MEYLTLAYANHFSVELTPDIIFYTVLCEIADEIKKYPETYRNIFTDSAEQKQLITIEVIIILFIYQCYFINFIHREISGSLMWMP